MLAHVTVRLVWLSVVLVAVGLLLWLTAPPRATLWVQANRAGEGTARCPRGTLEDHGACVPVPAPATSTTTNFVPRLPGRPEQVNAYVLPIEGAAEIVSWQRAPLPDATRLDGQALAIRPLAPAPLLSSGVQLLGAVELLAVDRPHGFLLLRVQSAAQRTPYLVGLAGLSAISDALGPGALPEGDESLGQINGALWFASRQLRPRHETADAGSVDASAWSDELSVSTDPRNVLPLADAP